MANNDDGSLHNNPLFGALIGESMERGNLSEAQQLQNNQLRDINRETKQLASENKMKAVEGMVAGLTRIQELNAQVESLQAEVEQLSAANNGATFALAGVRGVVREMLSELRRSDPKNPLLNKSVRDGVFNKVRDDLLPFSNRWGEMTNNDRGFEMREAVFGTSDSAHGGPEINQVTPNLAVREAIGLDNSHVTERTQFLGLVARLYVELKETNPNAPMLQEKSMIDAVEAYALDKAQDDIA